MSIFNNIFNNSSGGGDLTNKVDLDGSNAIFNNLPVIAINNLQKLESPDWSRFEDLNAPAQPINAEYTFEENGYLILHCISTPLTSYIGYKGSLDTNSGLNYTYILSTPNSLSNTTQYRVQAEETITKKAGAGTYGAYFLPLKQN